MKAKLLFILFAGFFATITVAQVRIAVIDTEYILEKIPEYQSAQNRLEQLAVEWQEEIQQRFAEIDRLYRQYQAEAVTLPEDVKVKRQNEIIEKEREVKELQKKRFGTNGDLAKKREELLKPIQDRVFNAIQEYAEENNYALILDKSKSPVILYSSSRLDKSDDILKKLGY